MGCVENIDINRFPMQSPYIGARVSVCFQFNSAKRIGGKIVRDDYEEPWDGIIALDDGRYVRMTECQYSMDTLTRVIKPKDYVTKIEFNGKAYDVIDTTETHYVCPPANASEGYQFITKTKAKILERRLPDAKA